MKRKFTAVLLCIALLLTLSVNVSAEVAITDADISTTDTQAIQVADDVVVSVDENDAEIIENENLGNNTAVPLSQNAAIISGGIYRIKNVASGKYMNVDYGIDADGTNIYQWTGDGSTEQKFKVVYSSSSDSYLLYAMCSSNGTARVADVYDTGGNLVNGANIKLHTSNEPSSQQVQIISVATGRYRIAMKKDNSFVFTAYGTSNGSASGTTSTSAGNIFLGTYTGATNQQWEFELLENPNTGAIPVGYLDSVTTSTIGGWAYQSDAPNTALDVHIYIINNSNGNQVVYTTKANVYRSDLYAAGYGNGYHAFHYNINWKTFVPGTYTIKAYAVGTHGATPQLTNTKSFTVRNVEGYAEIITSTYIEGWVWKPDAPNEPLDVHAYIYRSNGQVAHIATTIANHLRTDLAAAGKGNGYHGYRIYIDFDSLPEENLRVELHYVDNSGYHPAFYSGYYDNRMPINVIGMVDAEGVDFSTWATSEVIGYLYNIGTPNVHVSNSVTAEEILDKVKQSSFAVISTHGSQHTLEYCKNPNTTNEQRGDLRWNYIYSKDTEYFSNTRCLLLNACSAASEEVSPGNNIVNAFLDTGVQSVVGFSESICFAVLDNNGSAVDTTLGSELWAKIFVRELGNGDTVQTAADEAFEGMVTKHLARHGYSIAQLNDLIKDDLKFVEDEIYWGLDSYRVFGNGNLVVKH